MACITIANGVQAVLEKSALFWLLWSFCYLHCPASSVWL